MTNELIIELPESNNENSISADKSTNAHRAVYQFLLIIMNFRLICSSKYLNSVKSSFLLFLYRYSFNNTHFALNFFCHSDNKIKSLGTLDIYVTCIVENLDILYISHEFVGYIINNLHIFYTAQSFENGQCELVLNNNNMFFCCVKI